MRSVTNKQYGGVLTAPHVCWEKSPSKEFTEDMFFKQGKKIVFMVVFWLLYLLSRCQNYSLTEEKLSVFADS